MKFKEQLEDLNACEEAVEWVGDRDLKTAWEECARGDWMLWLAARLKVDRKLVALAACDCAETSLNFVLADEGRPAAALRIVRAWCAGEATLDEVKVAAGAAADAADASYADAAADAAAGAAYAAAAAAAGAAAYGADAAYAAAGASYADAAAGAAAGAAYAAAAAAAGAAVYAAGAAAYGADAAYAAARRLSLARSADIVRKRISAEILLEEVKDEH